MITHLDPIARTGLQLTKEGKGLSFHLELVLPTFQNILISNRRVLSQVSFADCFFYIGHSDFTQIKARE